MGSGAVSKKTLPRVPLRHGEGGKDHLTSFEGLAALSLDALSSVAYGPEAIVLVLVAAGTSALRLTLPVTLTIAALLAVLVVSYCQVIAVHPTRGGAYAVGQKDLGATVSLLAAASLGGARQLGGGLRAARRGQSRRRGGEPGLGVPLTGPPSAGDVPDRPDP